MKRQNKAGDAYSTKQKTKDQSKWTSDMDEDEDEPIFEEDAPAADVPVFLAGDMQEQSWARKEPEHLDPAKQTGYSIAFQVMDVDYTHGQPIKGMPGNQRGPVPIIRMFGVTADGVSVLLNVHGFLPYLWVPAPPNFSGNDIEKFRKALNSRIEGSNLQSSLRCSEYVLHVAMENKTSIMGYFGDQTHPYLKITLALPKHVPKARSILENGFSFPGFPERIYQSYESNFLFVLRFMVDTGVTGGGWVELPAGSFGRVDPSHQTSHSQWELNAPYHRIRAVPLEERSELAPIRILSFDIECAGRKGVFPDAKHDPVIQIANYITEQGSDRPIIRNLFSLGSCSSILGAQVICFDKEEDLLRAWRAFIIESDPDMITGYNICNFDIPYLVNRAERLRVSGFAFLGRLRSIKAKIRDAKFSSKAYGTRESKSTKIDGRVQFDLIQVMQRDYKLRSYGLNAVSAHFLGEQKEEVHHSIISDLFHGTDDDRRRLGIYCLKDAYLPQRLLDELMCVVNYIEMARVTGVPFSFLLERGQQVKVVSQLYRATGPKNLLIPAYRVKQNSDAVSYTGAVVIEPVKGFYEQPIATLDFASLYPSIMMAHNLCYSTLTKESVIKQMGLTEDQYVKTPNGHYFVTQKVKKGLLPLILENLLGARAKAKRELKVETNPFKKQVLNGRQLALKISANSVYGFTGATVGKLPCLEISAAVTAFGREMLHLTRDLVVKRYTIANGYPADATVVYGDTDSVMVNFGVGDVAKSMEIGTEAAEWVSTHFKKPISLEFEKVYFPYLLISKKRYAGLYWTKPEKYDKMDTKGIETVRRDNCRLVKNVITTCLQKILIDRDVQGAIEYTKGMISELLCNRLDISLLVISKSYTKKKEEYAGKQIHVELAEKMKKRDAATAPTVGDRVPYVIIKGPKGAATWEKAEDPLYVLKNNLPIDSTYYLQNQLAKPLARIFAPVLSNVNVLFEGDHTRTISMVTPKVGGIVGFTKVRLKCLNCKTVLRHDQQTVCDRCKEKEPLIFQKQLQVISKMEQDYARAWTQCQRCQGSLHQTVLCNSSDCPIFYRRSKLQKDLEDAHAVLTRFNLIW